MVVGSSVGKSVSSPKYSPGFSTAKMRAQSAASSLQRSASLIRQAQNSKNPMSAGMAVIYATKSAQEMANATNQLQSEIRATAQLRTSSSPPSLQQQVAQGLANSPLQPLAQAAFPIMKYLPIASTAMRTFAPSVYGAFESNYLRAQTEAAATNIIDQANKDLYDTTWFERLGIGVSTQERAVKESVQNQAYNSTMNKEIIREGGTLREVYETSREYGIPFNAGGTSSGGVGNIGGLLDGGLSPWWGVAAIGVLALVMSSKR